MTVRSEGQFNTVVYEDADLYRGNLRRDVVMLAAEDADVLRPAVRLYQDLTQLLRLCLDGPLDPKTAGAGLLNLLARAADVPDFTTLEAHLTETQAKVRASFVRILGRAP